MPSIRTVSTLAALVLVGCAHRLEWYSSTVPTARSARLCTEWRVEAARELSASSDWSVALAVDSSGAPTVVVAQQPEGAPPERRVVLTAQRWDGDRWRSDVAYSDATVTGWRFWALPQSRGRIALVIARPPSPLIFTGPPWAPVALAPGSFLGAVSDATGLAHVLLRDGDAVVYAVGDFGALRERWRTTLAGGAVRASLAVSPSGARLAAEVTSPSSRQWRIESDASSGAHAVPRVDAIAPVDRGFERPFGVDEDGSVYWHSAQLVERAGARPEYWGFVDPRLPDGEEHRTVWCPSQTWPPAETASCPLPDLVYGTMFPEAPMLVPDVLRGASGPRVVLLGARDRMRTEGRYWRPPCGNSQTPEGWVRSPAGLVSRQLVVGGLDDGPGPVHAYATPIVAEYMRVDAARLDVHGRIHTVLRVGGRSDASGRRPTRAYYAMLGCGQ